MQKKPFSSYISNAAPHCFGTNQINAICTYLCVALIVLVQIKLLASNEYGDEYETLVACKMMANGSRLYNDIFNHHGPLTFFIGYLLELVGDFGVIVHRIPILLLQWVAFLSVFNSPLIKKSSWRHITTACVIAGILGILSIYPFLGNMYLYQNIAGLFIVIINTQLVFPILAGMQPSKTAVFLCEFLNACLPFLAITYTPFAAVVFFLTLRKLHFRYKLLGNCCAVVFNLAFLFAKSSLAGYLAYHFYCNLTILASGTSTVSMLISSVASYFLRRWDGIVCTLATVALCFGFARLSKQKFPLKSLLIMLLPLTLAVRGVDFNFQSLPFWLCMFSFLPAFAFLWDQRFVLLRRNAATSPAATAPPTLQVQAFSLYASCTLIVLLCVKTFLFPIIPYLPIAPPSTFSQLAQLITEKDETILSLPFDNEQYVNAHRLPASAHFFYLPWQARYNEQPVLGIYTNLAKDILQNRPKIIFVDRNELWPQKELQWATYATDIDAVIAKEYYPFEDTTIYIRNDIDLSQIDLSSLTTS